MILGLTLVLAGSVLIYWATVHSAARPAAPVTAGRGIVSNVGTIVHGAFGTTAP